VEHVRPARDEDVPLLHQLVASALASTRQERGGELLLTAGPWAADPAPGVDATVVETLVASLRSAGALLVGEYEGTVVGFAAARVVGDHGRIDGCYVEPGARGVGVGAALVAAAVAWLGERGATEIDAVALPGDRDTKQLYETAGFKARALILHRPLGSSGAPTGPDGAVAGGS
jgi:GNAT superfamily N-acetyltransferase